ncbi:MAG TPA: glycosyltransferase [Anaerolineae bacterium]|nr:glycosyltransferase [Anaerolineae bacterium]
MRLLIATDHSYLRHNSEVFDVYCFDRSFFDDYRKVFGVVEVICRMKNVDSLPAGARRSDGDGVRFIGVPDIHGMAWLLRAGWLCGPVLKSAIKRVDAVVARVPSQLGWLAAKWARQAGKPYMIEVIGDPIQAIIGVSAKPHYRLIAWLEARRLRYLARYADVASYVGKYLQQAYPPSIGKPYDVVSSIRVDISEITQPRTFEMVRSKIMIMLVASLVPIKRHRDLIQALRLVVDQGINAELHLAGDGPCRKDLEELTRKLRLNDRVVFHGHIADRKALMCLLDASDLFVMTSASEGFPRALLEAMARGLPVAGTRAGGLEELVRGSELFPVGDVRALATLIMNLARDPERLTEMSRYSVEMASQYTSKILSPRRVRLYRILRNQAIRS